MALTQRLQMRQSQALVMTPQLMQAIKLLQLSNLDLAAYVEGELEKNPLLERAAEGEPGVVEGAPEAARRGVRRRRFARPRRTVAADRIDESLETSRSAIEERLGTDLENEFPDDAGQAAQRASADQPMRSVRLVQRRQRRARGRRLQSGSLRVGRADARRSSRRAACAGDRRSGPADDRAIPDRYGRRGRLPHRRSRVGGREARRAAGRSRSGAGDRAGFDPPGVCARNLTECLAIQLARAATVSIRRCRRWSAVSIFSPSAISPRCGASAASATKISPR